MMIIMTTALLMKNLYQAFLMTNRFHQHSFLTLLIVIDFMTSRLFIIAILATSHMQNIVQGQLCLLNAEARRKNEKISRVYAFIFFCLVLLVCLIANPLGIIYKMVTYTI